MLLKIFAAFARDCTTAVARHAEALARDAGRLYLYLPSASARKEDLAASIAARDKVDRGLIRVLACVEPCMTFDIHRNRERKRLELVSRQRKCRYFYFYFMDPTFGLIHVRLQSWLPLEVQVCLNGRSYLERHTNPT